MYNNQSNPTLSNCAFSVNSVEIAGGGMLNAYCSNMNIDNCTFSGNTAGNYGGVMINVDSSPTVTECTFSSNSANTFGGGIYNYEESDPMLRNCIFWDNTAPSGPQIYNGGTSSAIVIYSDVQGGWPGLGNIDVDPLFVDPGYWDPNGTQGNPDDDFWVEGDYHLKSEGWRWDSVRQRWDYDDVTSRCIDAGNPGVSLGNELMSAPDDPDNIWGENLRINMGAYGGTAQASMAPYDWSLLGDLTNDGTVNLVDYSKQAKDYMQTADAQPGDLNRNGIVDLPDLVFLAYDWLEETIWFEP